MAVRIIPLAGVAQRRERLVHPGDAGSAPAPRSIEPLVLIAAGLCAAIAASCIGLIAWAAWRCCGGML